MLKSDYIVLDDKFAKNIILVEDTKGKKLLIKKYNRGYPELFEKIKSVGIDGVPAIFEVDVEPDGFCIVEEYIEGNTLATLLKEKGVMGITLAIAMCRKVAEIVESLHRVGIVHGDIKPENIIVNDDKVYLIDFDASHFILKKGGRDTVLLGTPGFAAPEQYGFARSDERSDIYALGVILNVLVTGRYPTEFIADGRAGEIVRKATNIDPDNRYQSVENLIRELDNIDYRSKAIPGFRNNNPVHRAIGLIIYAGIVVVNSFAVTDYNCEALLWMQRICMAISGILIVFVIGNYQEIVTRFRFARKNVITRTIMTLALVVFIVAIMFIAIAILATIDGRFG